MIPTKEQDFLDQDSPIRGQNFVCMSFLSPEDVLRNKEVYLVSEFVSALGKQVQELIAGLEQKYPEDRQLIGAVRENHAHFFNADSLQSEYKVFLDMNAAELERKFYEANEFRTSIRGFKVRGVYDTYPEATNRAQVLKKSGDKFDIFVAQVGCWCPWSPNPSDLENQEYAETQLNTLMKGYQENNKKKDEYYEMRKKDRLDDAQKELEEKKQQLEELKRKEEEEQAASAAAAATETLALEASAATETLALESSEPAAPASEADAAASEKLDEFLVAEDPWSASRKN